MQSLVIFTPKQKFETEGIPSDFAEREAAEEAQAQVLYGQGGLRQVWALNIESKGAAVLFEATSGDEL